MQARLLIGGDGTVVSLGIRGAMANVGAAAALQIGSFFFADIEQNQVDEQEVAVLRWLAGLGEGPAVVVQE
jgi:hypothetical protein